jgi:quercetin dioxygenase-like cupin family protein
MRFATTHVALILATSLAFINVHAQTKGTPEETLSQTLLQTTRSWDGVKYRHYPRGQPELTVLKITIPPNTQLKLHHHPMPNAAYVVSGTLTVSNQGGSKHKIITSGHVLPEMVNTLHYGRSGNQAVELIVFYAGTPGMKTTYLAP